LLPLREIIGKLKPTLRATMSKSKVQSRLPRLGQVGRTLWTKRGGITYELLHQSYLAGRPQKGRRANSERL
jgi:hypothetical protein